MTKQPISLTALNFQDVVLRDDSVPVLVDFWAPWCKPCRVMEPLLDELNEELKGEAIIAKVNVDEEPLLADTIRIRSIPTLLLFRSGHLEDLIVGVPSKQRLREMLAL